MKGKDRCKILKDIRKRIADENDIEFIVSECKHKDDCLGTCPKCESELRYLERELEKRRAIGKKVTVAGLAISVTLATSSCASDLFSQPTAGALMPPESSEETYLAPLDGETEPPEVETLMGDVPPETVDTEEPTAGVLPIESETLEGELVLEFPGEIVDPELWEGELLPDESETDAPVSETVETVAETPAEEN